MDIKSRVTQSDISSHGNGILVDSDGVNSLLVGYLNALTDVCKMGILLAGKLDQQLQTKQLGNCKPKCSGPSSVDRKAMSHLGSFYTNILSKMGPLWQQTMFETADENTGVEDYTHHQYRRMESIGRCLVELHQSMVQSGKPLLGNTISNKQTPNYADSSGGSAQHHHALSNLEMYHFNDIKSHVPTDDDLNNIINFLSTTHIPTTNTTTAAMADKGKPGSIKARKLPLSNQRSSPLPETTGCIEKDDLTSLSESTRHHSDWQLYANALKVEGSNADRTQTLPSHLDSKQQSASSYNSLKLPFSSWSTVMNQDKRWIHDSAASSGDESHSNTELLFNNQTLDLTAIVNRTRRSSHDSSASSQAFDAAVPNAAVLNSSNIINQTDNWSCLTNSSISNWSSNNNGTMSNNPILSNSHTDSIWHPSGGMAPSPSLASSHNSFGAPFTTMSAYGQVTAQSTFM